MAANLSVGWETVGGAGKPIKKVGSEKQVAKKEAEAKKKFVEKGPKLEDVRKSTCFYFIIMHKPYGILILHPVLLVGNVTNGWRGLYAVCTLYCNSKLV